MITKAQIKAIYALGSSIGINKNNHDDELHQLVYGLSGKESIKELTGTEADDILSELRQRMKGMKLSSGSKKSIDVPPGKMSEAQQKKAWQLIYALQKADPSAATAAVRMRGAVKKILGADINTHNKAPFRMISSADGVKLINSLKRYVYNAEKKAGVRNGYQRNNT